MAVTTKIIIAIDIGSSSVRCSAYELFRAADLEDPRHLNNHNGEESPPVVIKAIDTCRSSRPVRSVQPNTGKIQIFLGHCRNDDGEQPDVPDDSSSLCLMDHVDECMDELLSKIRKTYLDGRFQILAVGFSSFVMNLVGVDSDGKIIGNEASISYACNSPDVAEQCRSLRR